MESYKDSPDLLVFEENLVPADAGKRFLNYLIDIVFFYLLMILFGVGLAIINPSAVESMDDSAGFGFADRIVSLLLYAVYMGIIEGLFKGKSLGKFITKTRAVNLDGSKIGWGTAFGRGFSRAVPFCAFSALGSPCNPWQDRWTSTMVIDEKNLINVQ